MYVDTLTSLGNILKTRGQQSLEREKRSRVNSFGGSIPNLSAAQREFGGTKNSVGSVQNLNLLNGEDGGLLGEEESIVSLLPKLPIGFPSCEEIMIREVGFVMLQLVNGLKSLQAKGIEEMPLSLSNVILCKEVENKEAQARLCVLQR